MDRIYHQNQNFSCEDLKMGGAFLVDKPLHWTSFDVVNKLRAEIKKILSIKKYKIGHAGTLDPLATGLLIICFGPSTKKIEQFMNLPKEYEATVKLGATRPSEDMETEINCYFPRKHIRVEMIDKLSHRFFGDILQKPPLFSAIKKNGVPLYRHARAGTSVEISDRLVRIHKLEICGIRDAEVDIRVNCSKGTYIRSLARDIGSHLDSGAHLFSLHRSKIGEYSSKNAWNLSELILAIASLA